MTISFIGASSANASSIAFGSHVQWDLILVMVHRVATTTPPTVPAGWRVVNVATGGSNVLITCCKIAESSGETSGTWTNADQIAYGIYRSDAKVLSLNNGLAQSGSVGSGGNIVYPKVEVPSPVTDKWLLAGFAHRSIDTDIESTSGPTGMTTVRTSVVGGAAGEMGFRDTNGNYTSWASTNYALTAGTSSGYKVSMVELAETGVDIPSGGGGRSPIQGLSQQGVSIF